MATQRDARRIALSFANVEEAEDRFGVGVWAKGKLKSFCWEWMERVHPKKPRVPNPEVLAVRVRGEEEKAALLASDSKKFFTEPHYNGYPAVLVRLGEMKVSELRKLITAAYLVHAPADKKKRARKSRENG